MISPVSTSVRLRSAVCASARCSEDCWRDARRLQSDVLAVHEASATLARLNQDTRAHHAAADAPWLALLGTEVRRKDYIRHLVITYGFEAPLEGAFAYSIGLRAVVNLRERTRSGLLAQDLLALGSSPAELSALPQCFSIVPFADVAEALGWLYVVERATLHHVSVRRNLVQRIPDIRHATSYLSAAGSVAGARWQALGVALDELATTESITDRIVTAADHAFRRWRDWLELNQPELRSVG